MLLNTHTRSLVHTHTLNGLLLGLSNVSELKTHRLHFGLPAPISPLVHCKHLSDASAPQLSAWVSVCVLFAPLLLFFLKCICVCGCVCDFFYNINIICVVPFVWSLADFVYLWLPPAWLSANGTCSRERASTLLAQKRKSYNPHTMDTALPAASS